MLYEFELGYDTVEATKNICAKGKGAFDHNTVTRLLKLFHLGCKNFDGQVKSGRPKIMGSKVVCQAIHANLVSSIWRVSGKL